MKSTSRPSALAALAGALALCGSGCGFIVGESFQGYGPDRDGDAHDRGDGDGDGDRQPTPPDTGGGDGASGAPDARTNPADAMAEASAASPDAGDGRGDASADGGEAGSGGPVIFGACADTGPWFDLAYPVTTAVYSRALDVLIVLRTDADVADIVDPESCLDRPVQLARPGLSLALAPSGRQVAVGEDGVVEMIDLEAAAVMSTFAIPRPASEVAVDATGQVQVYTRAPRGESAPLLAVGQDGTPHMGSAAIDAAGHVRATPDGSGLFWVVDNQTSADGYAGIDPSSGAITPNQNPVGSLHICHDLFPTDDSKHLISACGTVVRTSDLSFETTMQDVKLLQHVDTLVAKGMVVSVGRHDLFGSPNGPDDAGFVRIHDSAFFNSVRSIDLPALDVAGLRQIPIARFAFIRSDGRRIYALARRGGPVWGPLADGVARLDASGPDAGQPPVSVPQPPHYTDPPATVTVPSTTALLDFGVVDAAYSRALNRIVVSSNKPTGAVMLVNPDTGAAETINRPSMPSRIAISADGLTAAVVEQFGVQILDLQSRSFVREVQASSAVFGSGKQVLLGHNDFNDLRTTRLSWFDTDTGMERTVLSAFYDIGFTAIRGTQIYYSATASGLFPTPLFRHDDVVAGDDPSFDIGLLSPMDNVGTKCGSEMWISDDGSRLVLDCARVFRLSPTRASDLTYVGQLEFTRGVGDIAMADGTRRIFVASPTIFKGETYFPTSYVGVYDPEQLSLRALVDLTGAFDPRPSSVHVTRAFAAATPDRVYAIVTTDDALAANHDAIVTLDVSGL